MSDYLQLTPKLHARVSDSQKTYLFWCPGCEEVHGLPVRNDPNDGVHPSWTFDGNLEAPTFRPSLLHPHKPVCHLFITGGRIHFQNDCDHALTGKVVDMVEMDL